MEATKPMRVRPKKEKIIAAIQFIIGKEAGIDTYRLLKSILFADKNHLKQYGRPVTYDRYYAMKDGPVPSNAYNYLKNKEGLWEKKADSDSPRIWRYTKNLRPPNLDILSESDIEELDAALGVIRELNTFARIKAASHDAVFDAAWERRGDRKSTAIDMEDWVVADTDKQRDEIRHMISMA